MYQLHLEPTKAAKPPAVDRGLKDKKKRHLMLPVRWSLLLFSGVLKLPLVVFILLYGFKIKVVSIKVNHVEFKINPCQQTVHIFHCQGAYVVQWIKSAGGSYITACVAVIINDHTVAV